MTRRRVGVAEFDPAARDVLERLVRDRLLTRDGDTIEVAHEALLREWPRLQGWLQEDERGREMRRHLTQAAAQWRDAGREDAELYRGARLSAALDWAAGRQGELNELEREFLDAGRRAGEREAERQRRTNRRLRGALIGAVGLLALAVAAGAVALVQRSNARKSATVALSQSLGSQAVVEPRLDRAMLLAREAVSLDDSIRTRGNLVSTLVRAPQLLGTIAASENRLLNAALSPDGKTLAVADNTSTVSFVDPRTGEKVGEPMEDFPGVTVTYSPDGRFIVMPVGDDKGRTLGIDLLDAKTHRRVERLPLAPRIARVRFLGAGIARFSSDGRTLAVGFLAEGGPAPGLMEFFDVASRRSLGTAVRASPGGLRVHQGRPSVVAWARRPCRPRRAVGEASCGASTSRAGSLPSTRCARWSRSPASTARSGSSTCAPARSPRATARTSARSTASRSRPTAARWRPAATTARCCCGTPTAGRSARP